MKKSMKRSLGMGLAVVVILVVTRSISIIPWWGFVIPVLILGAVGSYFKWEVQGFTIGFLSGFVVWFSANLYFDTVYGGIILGRVGQLLHVPRVVIMTMSSFIGGVLCGLALHTGKSVFI